MIQVSTGSKYDLYRKEREGSNAEKFVNFFPKSASFMRMRGNISRHVPILAKSL